MKILGILIIGSLVIPPPIAFAISSSCKNGDCAAACDTKLGYCMTVAGLDNESIQNCISEVADCYQDACGCQPPLNNRLDGCFGACRTSMLECNNGNVTSTLETSPGCAKEHGNCMYECMSDGNSAHQAAKVDMERHDIRAIGQNGTIAGIDAHEDDCDGIRKACSASGAGDSHEHARCLEAYDLCINTRIAVGLRTARTDIGLKAVSNNLSPNNHLDSPGNGRYYVPFFYCTSENGEHCDVILFLRDECRNLDIKPWWGHPEWKYDRYKSIRMFHDSPRGKDGAYDYCRFWETHDCDNEWYTECQGSCNLKNIHGKLRSVRCVWNTTYYPS